MGWGVTQTLWKNRGSVQPYRTIQVRTAQVRIDQVRIDQVRVGQVRTAQVRTAQVRIAQVRIDQALAAQVAPGQVETGIVGHSYLPSPKVPVISLTLASGLGQPPALNHRRQGRCGLASMRSRLNYLARPRWPL